MSNSSVEIFFRLARAYGVTHDDALVIAKETYRKFQYKNITVECVQDVVRFINDEIVKMGYLPQPERRKKR